jgi:hypothetical protein
VDKLWIEFEHTYAMFFNAVGLEVKLLSKRRLQILFYSLLAIVAV